ncbi:MBL fold metallo-hydrolase [Candidatus Dojkabacteria bacterium]|uniref:MBL fold metallo-hydrolase n=1 Tax=Candidatus Dojkabacteria bacterium TaxID=2099670 RepID=A0A847VDB6_9BACT|nr:MBL fold metallo-hydrolase [Candidatus Dojkabacteria bacterium]
MKSRVWRVGVWLLLVLLYLLSTKYEDSVVFLDVGQGDAILIQSGTEQILVDTGPNGDVIYKLQRYMPFFDRRIEYIVLTHPHQDHLGGILEILERYEVGKILYYPVCYSNNDYEYLLQNFDNLIQIGRGDTIRLKNIEVDVLWPILERSIKECVKPYNGNVNNDSLVLEFEYLNKKFLLMGDIEREVESVLVAQDLISSNYDVLKAGHHCSKTSSSETFLEYTSPSFAVCSVGIKNSFGHPSSETLKNFSRYGVKYLLTSEQGDIQVK